jgi:predicted aspartyl protease
VPLVQRAAWQRLRAVTCAGVACALLTVGWSDLVAAIEATAASDPPPASAVAARSTPSEAGAIYAVRTNEDRVGRIVVPVEIDGRGSFRFILDTGANTSVMSEATALALGMTPVAGLQVNVNGVTGAAAMPAVRVESLRAGELLLKDQRLPVLPAAVFAGANGILGVDALQDARIEVDFAHDRVTVRRSNGRRAPKGFLVIRGLVRNGGLLLVDGHVGRVPVKAIVDTGAERSIGNEALRTALVYGARRPHETSTAIVIGATPQLAQGLAFAAPAIEIGGARLNNLTVTFGDLHVFEFWSLLDEPAILIGMDLLGRLDKFVVDYLRQEFHIRPVASGKQLLRRCGTVDCGTRIPPPGT